MSPASPAPKYYRFGRFTLDLSRGSLKSDAGDVPLRPKAFEVLRILVENHGCLVDKERLHTEAWDRAPVSDESLTQCVVDIRKALGDDVRNFIKTVPRRGYVFDAPVEVSDSDPVPAVETQVAPRRFPRLAMGGIAAGVVAAIAWASVTMHGARPPRAGTGPGPVPAVTAALPSGSTITNHDAPYAAYRKGTELLERRTGTAIEGAIEFFRDAIRLDPGFALAYVGLADGYLLLKSHGEQSAAEVLPEAYAAAQTALELDGSLGEAHATLGAIFNEAEANHVDLGVSGDPAWYFKRAIELSPDYATAYQWYGEYLRRTVGNSAAIEQFRVALSHDPESPIINHMLSITLASQGRFEEAEQLALRATSIDPGFARAHQGLAALYFRDLGRLADAATAAHKALLLNPSDSVNAALLANIHINMGDNAQAGHWLREGRKGQADQPEYQMIVAYWHVMREDTLAAVSLLEELNRNPNVPGFTARLLKDHYIREGDLEAALSVCERRFPGVFTAIPDAAFDNAAVTALECAQVLKMVDRKDEAQVIVDRIRRQSGEVPVRREALLPVFLAMIHALEGDQAQAIAQLREAVDKGWRYNGLYYLERSPIFASLHALQEYQALLAHYRELLAREREMLENRYTTVANLGIRD